MGFSAKDSPYAPSRHQLVSMFGRQPASQRATAPFAKFGTGTRDQAMNVSPRPVVTSHGVRVYPRTERTRNMGFPGR